MTEVIKLRVEAIAAKVREQAGESRKEKAEEWLENLQYCMKHMDVQAFATTFLCYMEWLADLAKKPVAKSQDKIVNNTILQLAFDLALVQGKKRSKLQMLSEETRKETLLPCGIWVWRGHRCRMYKTSNGVRMEASIDKYNSVQQMESLVGIVREMI